MTSCILVTGAAGFIASHVVDALLHHLPKVKIIGLDRLDYCSSVKNLVRAQETGRFQLIKGDIRSSDLVCHVLQEHKVDTIMHFAAQTHVDNSFGNSLEFTQSNIVGTHTLLEATHKIRDRLRLFIHVSTDEVYGENEDAHAFDPSCALNPTNPYAATKAAAEFLVKSYGHSYKLPYIITRGNNVYGPRQFPEKVIPKFVQLLHTHQKVPLHGTGEQVRSFLYVTDVAEAFVYILRKGQLGEIYNIGTDFEISMRHLAEELIQRLQPSETASTWIESTPDRNYQDRRYFISSHKLKALGWCPKIEFSRGLTYTAMWYAENPQYWK